MTHSIPRRSLLLSIAILAISSIPAFAQLQIIKTIKIGGDGRWDYATLDAQGQYLYLTRTTHTQVIDTASGNLVADIPGGKGLHGTALVPDQNRGFISDGKGAAVIIFDLKTNAVLGTLPAPDDADGIIYDPPSAHVFVACGDSAELLPIPANVDPTSGKPDPPIDLGGKPEFLVSDGKGKIFICLADQAQIAVIDTKTMKVIAKYPTDPGKTPTGLAMDRDRGRLFIGCRNQKMIVMDARDGTILADLPIGKTVDACTFDGATAYASCGDGTLTAVLEAAPGKYVVAQTLNTALGARTMALDTQTATIYLPTADMLPTTNPSARPKPIAGTFKILVVATSSK